MDVSLGIVQVLPHITSTTPTTATLQSATHHASTRLANGENSNLTLWGRLWSLFFPQSSSPQPQPSPRRLLATVDGNAVNTNNSSSGNNSTTTATHRIRQSVVIHAQPILTPKEREERKKERELQHWMGKQPLRRADYRRHHRRLSATTTTGVSGVPAGSVSNEPTPVVIKRVDSGPPSDTSASDNLAVNQSTYKV